MNAKQIVALASILVLAMLAFVLLHSPNDNGSAAPRPGNRSETGHASVREQFAEQAPPASAASSSSKTSTQDVPALLDRVQQIQRELDAVKRQGDSNIPSQPIEEPLTVAEQQAQERERTNRTTEFLESNFVTESKDPFWSMQAEKQVSDTFGADEISAGSQLQQLSCQSTLCRIESRHKDPGAERSFLTRLGRLNAFGDAEAFSERIEQADGSIATVTYVSRNGHRLPRME